LSEVGILAAEFPASVMLLLRFAECDEHISSFQSVACTILASLAPASANCIWQGRATRFGLHVLASQLAKLGNGLVVERFELHAHFNCFDAVAPAQSAEVLSNRSIPSPRKSNARMVKLWRGPARWQLTTWSVKSFSCSACCKEGVSQTQTNESDQS